MALARDIATGSQKDTDLVAELLHVVSMNIIILIQSD